MLISMQFLLGVDEAGRAPLAGPVAVGVVAVADGFDVAREFPGIKDSKQLSELARERLFVELQKRVERGDARFRVSYGSHTEIDARGITIAVRRAVRRSVLALVRECKNEVRPLGSGLKVEPRFRILLDGLLYAPREYPQETVIHGDDLIPIISLASIAAKVSRDRLMRRLAKHYPAYGFERHKGYATRAHYAALALHGPCAIHRMSYLHLD